MMSKQSRPFISSKSSDCALTSQKLPGVQEANKLELKSAWAWSQAIVARPKLRISPAICRKTHGAVKRCGQSYIFGGNEAVEITSAGGERTLFEESLVVDDRHSVEKEEESLQFGNSQRSGSDKADCNTRFVSKALVPALSVLCCTVAPGEESRGSSHSRLPAHWSQHHQIKKAR